MNILPPAAQGGSDSGIPGLLGKFLGGINPLRSGSPLGNLFGGAAPGTPADPAAGAPAAGANQFALGQAMKLLGGGSQPMAPMPWMPMNLRPPGRMG
jgi:hypothetical protein